MNMQDRRDNIKINGLTIRYGKVAPVQDVSFTCKEGEFVALVGKSGTGKSSILNAVARFIDFEGNVQANGQLGYIFQHHALYPWMTCRQNIGFGLEDIGEDEKRGRVNELLEKIDMAAHAEKYPAQLSGGQVQRVAIARTLAVQPKILLADEPFAALDFMTRDKMHEWFLQVLKTVNPTVLFVTHFIEEAIYLADRVLVLKDAMIVGDLKVPLPRSREPDMKFTEEFVRFKREVLTIM